MKTRKPPIRQCLGCREHLEKRQLIRVVKNKEGEVSLDFTGKASGRGAYVCKNIECLKKAIKSKAISRALDAQIPDEIYDTLLKEMEGEVFE